RIYWARRVLFVAPFELLTSNSLRVVVNVRLRAAPITQSGPAREANQRMYERHTYGLRCKRARIALACTANVARLNRPHRGMSRAFVAARQRVLIWASASCALSGGGNQCWC